MRRPGPSPSKWGADGIFPTKAYNGSFVRFRLYQCWALNTTQSITKDSVNWKLIKTESVKIALNLQAFAECRKCRKSDELYAGHNILSSTRHPATGGSVPTVITFQLQLI